MGGGDPWSDNEELASTEGRRLRSLSNRCSYDNEFDDRADFVSSSYAARSDDVDDLCNSNALVRDRNPVGPGSLSTVANEMTDILPKSDDDTERSSSHSLFRPLGLRSSLQPENGASPYLPPAATRVVVLLSLS